MTRTTVRLPAPLLTQIEARAVGEARSVSQTIRLILSREFGVPCAQKLVKKQNPELALK
jgi:hypothetical protein